MDTDDENEPNLFKNRAARIMKSGLEAYEKFEAEQKAEETQKEEEDEYTGLLDKIKEKLKRKPIGNKRQKRKKAKKEVIDVEEEIAEEEISPPRVTRRTTRRTKQPLVKGIGDTKKPKAPTPLHLPALAKRRLNELKLRTDREAAQVEEEVMRTLSSCDKDFLEASFSNSLVEVEQTITLKIRYMSEISKVEVQDNEKFSTIFTKVADLYKLKASEILLCLEDQNIQLEDTPLSLDLKFYDIIDCIPFKSSEISVNEDDPNNLLVKFQSSDSRKKIEMHIHKLETFKDFLEKYAKMRDIPLKNLTFEFDGETIEGSETPEELDMESGSCIDVRVAKLPEKESDLSIIEEYIAPIPQDQMLNICVLD